MAVATGMVAAAVVGSTDAQACCAEFEAIHFDVKRPRNTLVRVQGRGGSPYLRRVAPMGPPGRRWRAESIPLAPLGVGDLWRPERLLEVGAAYEIVVGLDASSRFVVEGDVDVSPPDFAGVRAATFRRSAGETTVEIIHHRLPPDVAFTVVRARRQGLGRIGTLKMLGFRQGVMMGDFRNLTVLSSVCDFADAPPMEIGATYCVSVAALDAAGNASGGDVEVCSPVIGPPPDPDEVQLKEVTLPVWASPRVRSAASMVAVLVLFAAWRWRRRRRVSVLCWGR